MSKENCCLWQSKRFFIFRRCHMFENFTDKIRRGFLFFDPEILEIRSGKKSVASFQKKYEKQYEDVQDLKNKAQQHDIPLQEMMYYKGNLIYKNAPDSLIESIDKGDIKNSIIYKSSLDDKIFIVRSVIVRSTLKGSSVYDSIISDSYFSNVLSTSCTINASEIRDSSCRETKASNTSVENSTFNLSSLVHSTLVNSSMHSCEVERCKLFDGNYRYSNLTQINSIMSQIQDSVVHKAYITSSDLRNVTLKGFKHFSEIHQSELKNINISSHNKNIKMDSVYVYHQDISNIQRFSIPEKIAYLTDFYTDGEYVYGYADQNYLYPKTAKDRSPSRVKLTKDLRVERGMIKL